MSLDAILKQYETNTSNASKKMTSDERLKQYFTTFIKDGINSATKRVRILPVGENETPFVEVMGHKAQVNGQWRTFVCPKHEGPVDNDKCPFCDAREKLLATGLDTDKELAKKYSARRMYVAKVIDRDNPDEGPKFWRFNHDYRKTGIFDKIAGVAVAISDSENSSITDAQNGRDLIINIARDQNGRPTVNSIVQSDPTPLHVDAETSQSWVNNTKTWKDVYSVKPYTYLEIIVKGGEPTWKRFDDVKEGEPKGEWVDKNLVEETTVDNSEDELTIGSEEPTTITETTTEQPVTEKPVTEQPVTEQPESDSKSADDEEDDLPF